MLERGLTWICLDCAQRRAAIQEYAEAIRAAEGDSLRRGPWELEAADRPGALPGEYEILKDREHMYKVQAPPPVPLPSSTRLVLPG